MYFNIYFCFCNSSHFATAWAWGGYESFWDPVRWRDVSWRCCSIVFRWLTIVKGPSGNSMFPQWTCGVSATWLTPEQEEKSNFPLLGIIQKSYLTTSTEHTMNFKWSQCNLWAQIRKRTSFFSCQYTIFWNLQRWLCVFLPCEPSKCIKHVLVKHLYVSAGNRVFTLY